MDNGKFYKNYSYKQYKFIQSNGIQPINSGINEKTNKRYWLYELTPELSDILRAYTEYFTKKEQD